MEKLVRKESLGIEAPGNYISIRADPLLCRPKPAPEGGKYEVLEINPAGDDEARDDDRSPEEGP